LAGETGLSDGSERSRRGQYNNINSNIEEMATAISLIHKVKLNLSRVEPVLLG